MKKAKRKIDLKDIKPIFVLGVILLLLFAFSTAFLEASEEAVTGQMTGVRVNFYGSSNTPLSAHAGKIQTKVTISQPTLRNLKYSGTTIEVANAIMEAADFASGITDVYTGSVSTPVPTDALSAVITGGGMMTNKFAEDTTCLRNIGSNYGSYNEFTFVIVSDLTYSQCWYYDDWLVAQARHTYYSESGSYLCREYGSKLFAIEMGTGKTSTNTYGC